MSDINELIGEFKLLRFNVRRRDRGAPAAEVEINSDDLSMTLWMSKADIKRNIREFGPHPGLLLALGHYKNPRPFPTA